MGQHISAFKCSQHPAIPAHTKKSRCCRQELNTALPLLFSPKPLVEPPAANPTAAKDYM